MKEVILDEALQQKDGDDALKQKQFRWKPVWTRTVKILDLWPNFISVK